MVLTPYLMIILFFNSLEFKEEICHMDFEMYGSFHLIEHGNMYLGDGQNLWEEINFEHYESKGGLNLVGI